MREKERVEAMDKESKATSSARRAFLKTAGLGAGVAATGAIGAVALDAAPAGAETSATAEGYRETAHVKRFYELAKKF
jgi:nitrous oxide reductase